MTRIRLTRPATGGRVCVEAGVSALPDQPVIRPMLLSCTANGARISLVPEGALLLAGDHLRISISVGAGACLELSEPAGTVAYSMFGGRATWQVDVDLEPRARLVWAGEPFVVSEGADVSRHTRVTMGWDSSLALRETLVLGRHGERPGRLLQTTTITGSNDLPMLAESLEVGPDTGRLLLGGHRAIGTIITGGPRLPDDLGEGTVMQWEALGTLARRMASDAHAAQLPRTWAAAIGR